MKVQGWGWIPASASKLNMFKLLVAFYLLRTLVSKCLQWQDGQAEIYFHIFLLRTL